MIMIRCNVALKDWVITPTLTLRALSNKEMPQNTLEWCLEFRVQRDLITQFTNVTNEVFLH